VLLFRRTIDVLTAHGYEVFYYTYTDSLNTEILVSHELDDVIELCLDDMKNEQLSVGLHVMGHFICGARALMYGINGQHRDHVRTIIGINPLVQPNDTFMKLNSSLKSRWKLKMNPNALVNIDTSMELFTKDPSWLAYLEEEKYSFTTFTNLQLKSIQDISHTLTSKKNSRQFSVQNLLIIQSIEDPLSKMSGTQQFINNNGAKSAFLLEYTKGMNNLFLEREKLFQRLITDLIAWLEEN
jgi:alpha-beta hydrolase superfamily lysophospholipase